MLRLHRERPRVDVGIWPDPVSTSASPFLILEKVSWWDPPDPSRECCDYYDPFDVHEDTQTIGRVAGQIAYIAKCRVLVARMLRSHVGEWEG